MPSGADDASRSAPGDGAVVDADHWQTRLGELSAEHLVPGASLGIMRLRGPAEPEITVCAHGTLNMATSAPVRPDSVFQLGSITKVWTAALVMGLVEEGRLELDAPVRDVLPSLALRDEETARSVTMRQLLTHTSGIDGDLFIDTGRGDDALARYVEQLAGVGQVHRAGSGWSYCNAGYVIAGHVVEVLTGVTFETAIRERAVGPLGLTHTVMLPEEALLHSTAVGHVGSRATGFMPTRQWGFPRAIAPAGLVSASALDLLTWTRAVIPRTSDNDGASLLTSASLTEMAAEQIRLPLGATDADSWGLGWKRFEWNGHRVLGHEGQTIGQSAFLRVLPEEGLAVVLLTNGGNTRDLFEELGRELFGALSETDLPGPLPEVGETCEPEHYLGTFERLGKRIEIRLVDDELVMRQTETGPEFGRNHPPPVECEMRQIDEDHFVIRLPGTSTNMPVTFTSFDGRPFLHYGHRAFPRTSSPGVADAGQTSAW